MAKAPSTAASFDGKGQVWFKVFQISGVADPTGAKYPEFPATSKFRSLWLVLDLCSLYIPRQDLPSVTFKIPQSIPSGEYLLRTEYIALYVKLFMFLSFLN